MPFMLMPSNQYILPTNLKMPLLLQSLEFYRIFTATTMDTADYWPMAREYSIWNAAIASLQFWTEDLNPINLGRATEQTDSTPICSDSSDEEEEDFLMVPLDDEHWISEERPERTFCIHEHG